MRDNMSVRRVNDAMVVRLCPVWLIFVLRLGDVCLATSDKSSPSTHFRTSSVSDSRER